jgi:hypothetical protein
MSDQEFNSNENFTNVPTVPKSCVLKKINNTGNLDNVLYSLSDDWCLSDEGGQCYDQRTCINRGCGEIKCTRYN